MSDELLDELPEYVREIIRAFANGETLKPGVHHVRVAHDKRCAIFKGGRCNCHPDVELIVTAEEGTR